MSDDKEVASYEPSRSLFDFYMELPDFPLFPLKKVLASSDLVILTAYCGFTPNLGLSTTRTSNLYNIFNDCFLCTACKFRFSADLDHGVVVINTLVNQNNFLFARFRTCSRAVVTLILASESSSGQMVKSHRT